MEVVRLVWAIYFGLFQNTVSLYSHVWTQASEAQTDMFTFTWNHGMHLAGPPRNAMKQKILDLYSGEKIYLIDVTCTA